MRLSKAQQQIIKKVVKDVAGENAQVKLFGSRVDDNAKGGDIDLLIILSVNAINSVSLAGKLTVKLMRALLGRKVDVLLLEPNTKPQVIHQMANKYGVFL